MKMKTYTKTYGTHSKSHTKREVYSYIVFDELPTIKNHRDSNEQPNNEPQEMRKARPRQTQLSRRKEIRISTQIK
jgi:hypothetical protein